MHNLGHPPRRLVMLHLDGSDAVLPSPGDRVVTMAVAREALDGASGATGDPAPGSTTSPRSAT